MEATGAPEQRREPVKTEDAVASFMRDIAARNWQEPTQRKFRTLLVDRLQFYAASPDFSSKIPIGQTWRRATDG